MPRSKKPRVKRAGANPVKKTGQQPAWYQGLNGTAGQHGERPIKEGKKSKNTGALT